MGARDEVVPSVAVAPPDADEVDVLVRYVYPGVRFSQGKVVVLRAPKTDGADRADPVHDAAAADDDDDEGDGILGSASAAGSAPATVTGADVVAALRRDGVDVARWRPRVALRLGDHDPAAAAAASEDADAASRSRGGDDAWRRRPVVPGFVGWRALGEDDVVTFDVGSVGLLVQLEDALVADTVPGASDKKTSKFGAPFSKKGGGGRRRRRRKEDETGDETGEERGDEDEPPREGEGEPPRALRLRAADYRGRWGGGGDDDALIE